MNYTSNVKLFATAAVLALACTACSSREEREEVVVESEVETEAQLVDETTNTRTQDQMVETEVVEDTEIAEAEPQYEPAPETLPQTAGPLPAIGLAGVLSLLAGFGLSLRRRS